MRLQRLIFPDVPVYIPVYGDLISAGFPSPAADYIESGIDLCRIYSPPLIDIYTSRRQRFNDQCRHPRWFIPSH